MSYLLGAPGRFELDFKSTFSNNMKAISDLILSPSASLFGVSVSTYVCDYKNGTLCNSQLENYDTNLQLKTQTIRKLQCFTCETPSGNADQADECFTIPSTAKVNTNQIFEKRKWGFLSAHVR